MERARATAGATIDGITVDLRVTTDKAGDVLCMLECDGREAAVIFQKNGEISFDVPGS
jgi:hypothetical protein